MEVLHTFDNIEGELNFNTNDGVNNEMPIKPTDIKKGERWKFNGKSVDDENCNLFTGNFDLKLENKDNNSSPVKGTHENPATDQNYNLTSTEPNKDVMSVTGKTNESIEMLEKPLTVENKLANSVGLELNHSRISLKTGINMNASSDIDMILEISDESHDSDTDEVDSDSSDDEVDDQSGKTMQKEESLLEEFKDSILENHEGDVTIDKNEAEHVNSATLESKSQNKSKNQLDTSQTTLIKFLVPRQSPIQESLGIENETDATQLRSRISISQLIINSCTYCYKGQTTFGIKKKKCKACGKRMTFNCFICEKLYNNHTAIYSHVLQFHKFSLNLFNEKIHAIIKSICSNCQSTFDPEYSVCSKCNLNLGFVCLVCGDLCGSRHGIHMHAVQKHTQEFVKAPKPAGTNRSKTAKVNKEKSLLQDDVDKNQKDAKLVRKKVAASKNFGPTQTSSGDRRVRFQLNNAEADGESEIKDVSVNEASVETLGPTPRYPVKRRSIGAKVVASTDSKPTNKLPNPKPNVSNRRHSFSGDLDSSKSKIFTENNSGSEAITKTSSPKQPIVGMRRSSRVNLNSSEVNDKSEAMIKDKLSAKNSSAASNISERRRSLQGILPTQNKIKSNNDIQPKKSVGEQIKSTRKSSRISSDNSSINNQNKKISVNKTAGPKISEPGKQITNKRRRSLSTSDNSEISNHRDVTFADVHPVPLKYDSKQQTATNNRRRSLRTMSDNSEASSLNAVTPVPMQQMSSKRQSLRNTSINSETNSRLENSFMSASSATPKIFASKTSVAQVKRRSSRVMLNISGTNSHDECTSPGLTAAPEMTVTRQRVANKRHKSHNSISVGTNDSLNESTSEFSDLADPLQCSICQKKFGDQKSCNKHESFCKKEADILCDSCSYTTKYISNMKKHKYIMHGPLEDPEPVDAKKPRTLLSKMNDITDVNVDFGALYSLDSACTEILNKMEAHCPNCMEDAKMKPNNSNCRKCKMKLMLSCLKCGKDFSDFLAIFNHLYMECSDKQYHCARCNFTTTSLDLVQAHVKNIHSNRTNNVSFNSSFSSDTPFTFAAQPLAPVPLSDKKMKLKAGFKTREQSFVKAKEKVAVEGSAEIENKLKKCPKCNVKVPSLVKHLMQCKAEVKCPFCSYMAKAKYLMRKHLVRCHNSKSHTIKFQAVFSDEKMSKNRSDIQEMMQSYCKTCDELQESVPYEIKCAACETDLEYRCAKCPGKFALREQLRKHVWSHAKAAKYLTCTGCSKRFAFAQNLRMHEKVCTAALFNASI